MSLIDAYSDGELDPLSNRTVESHLENCADCRLAFAEHQQLWQKIEQTAPYSAASGELRRRVQSALRGETTAALAKSVVPAESQSPLLRQTGAGSWKWLPLAAAVLLGAFLGVLFSPMFPRANSEQFLASELIASHARSLMAAHLTDVPSSDQHTVKPWLDSKLDFAPSVVDLTGEGFPLIGGRLDYIGTRPVAALVYQRRKHFINLFVWPTSSDAAGSQTLARQGYHLVHWTMGDLTYWAVSDVNEDDLQTFSRAFQQQSGKR